MINYETEVKQRLADGKTAATIASEINADRVDDPKNYRPVKSHEVANWLAGDGLESRITNWFFDNPDHVNFDVLKSAFEGVKAIRVNVNATMRVAPGEEHRQLITTAMALGVMVAGDLNRIDAIAYTGNKETAETVQAAIDLHDSPASKWQRFVTGAALHLESNPDATFEEIKAAGETAV